MGGKNSQTTCKDTVPRRSGLDIYMYISDLELRICRVLETDRILFGFKRIDVALNFHLNLLQIAARYPRVRFWSRDSRKWTEYH